MADPIVIFETVHGSRAYGLDRAGSDLDLKGVIVGPPEWYFGRSGGPEQIEHSADHVQYELRKFFRLCAGANPTVIEVLFTPPYLVRRPWTRLRVSGSPAVPVWLKSPCHVDGLGGVAAGAVGCVNL